MPSAAAASMAHLPAGFRFHPTDEELVVHYLANQAAGAPCPAPVIAEANIYACNPWELNLIPTAARDADADAQRYFFSPRDRKYPNGARPNRAAGGGYWKATGTDRPVLSSSAATGERVVVGVKKALVFYSGRPPRGVKTDWIMHEYRLVTDTASAGKSATATSKRSSRGPSSSSSSMRLDDWVLCRIYKKSNSHFSSSLQQLIISDQEQEQLEEASSTVEQEDDSSIANNINTAATLASSPKSSGALDHDGHQFLQTQTTAAPMSKSCSLTDLLNTIDCTTLSQMLLLDGGGPEEADAHAEPLIYYPPQGTTAAQTHLQQSLNYYNSNNNNVMRNNSSSSHFISSTNNLLPPRAVDACCSESDNNGLMMKRKQRTMTAAMDGAAGAGSSSLDDDDGGSSKKLKLLPMPSDSRNNPIVGSTTAGSYRNQLQLVDTNNAAGGFQFHFQPGCSLMTTSYNPFIQMQ